MWLPTAFQLVNSLLQTGHGNPAVATTAAGAAASVMVTVPCEATEDAG
jgi:hypothetical protein